MELPGRWDRGVVEAEWQVEGCVVSREGDSGAGLKGEGEHWGRE